MNAIDRLNRTLDSFPRVRFNAFAHPIPAFRSCGVIGFHLAMMVTVCVGLARGHSLAVLLALSAICGASFYLYALARKWITGGENLVLLEHVWFALACSAAALVAMGAPILVYLDAVACGLAFFLSWGRIGCFLVGCCHGLPSDVGVRYGEAHAGDGFPAELVGVRLYPVQLVEAGGLFAIGALDCAFVLGGAEGAAISFFLVSYAVMRFGLESIRGDPRPHFLGISQSRWMAIAEVGVAVALSRPPRGHPVALAILGAFGAVCLAATVARGIFGRRARALGRRHVEALRESARTAAGQQVPALPAPCGFTVASSEAGRVVSLFARAAVCDLPLLCEVAAAAFPELAPESVRLSDAGVLVFELPAGLETRPPKPPQELGYRLFARVARARQRALSDALPVDTSEASNGDSDCTLDYDVVPRPLPSRAGYFAPVTRQRAT